MHKKLHFDALFIERDILQAKAFRRQWNLRGGYYGIGERRRFWARFFILGIQVFIDAVVDASDKSVLKQAIQVGLNYH